MAIADWPHLRCAAGPRQCGTAPLPWHSVAGPRFRAIACVVGLEYMLLLVLWPSPHWVQGHFMCSVAG